MWKTPDIKFWLPRAFFQTKMYTLTNMCVSYTPAHTYLLEVRDQTSEGIPVLICEDCVQ